MAAGNIELDLSWGGDLTQIETGDLLLAVDTLAGPTATIQRLIRVLLTNPGDDIFNPTFAVGLSGQVDENWSPQMQHEITSSVSNWLASDAAVSQNPAPIVVVSETSYNTVSVNVQFTDITGNLIVLPQLNLNFNSSGT